MYEKELQIAKELAVKAGYEIMKVYTTDFSVELKEDNSPLTEADLNANAVIVSGLENEFSDYAILSEELQDDLIRMDNDYCWIVDPLDGTKEFIKKNDEFTVNIALSYQGKSIIGVVYVPVTEELYYAVEGQGAYYEFDNKVERIHVSEREEAIVLLSSRSHRRETFTNLVDNNSEKIDSIMAVGSSLKGCLIARGVADVYYRYGPTGEWDTAAMEVIVKEAGGIMKELNGLDFKYNRKNNINEIGFYILNSLENKLDE